MLSCMIFEFRGCRNLWLEGWDSWQWVDLPLQKIRVKCRIPQPACISGLHDQHGLPLQAALRRAVADDPSLAALHPELQETLMKVSTGLPCHPEMPIIPSAMLSLCFEYRMNRCEYFEDAPSPLTRSMLLMY